MKATIYKIIIFDAERNESIVDPLIFWNRDAAIREAKRIYDDPDIIADSIRVYEEEADKSGEFRTREMIFKLTKED